MAKQIINRYATLSFDEINESFNMKRKAEKKLREIETLKKRTNHTPEELAKIAREQEWLDILNPPPPTTPHLSTEPAKQTNKQRKKEKEREAKKKRAEELRKQQEAREQKEQEQREKYQREYQARQEEVRRAWKEQEERQRKRDATLGNKYVNDPLAIELYTTFNSPLAIHLYTEYGDVKTKKENRIAFHRLSLKYHPDKTHGTTTEHQKIIGFIRDYLQEVLR